MTDTLADQSACFDEIAQIRSLAAQVSAGLTAQNRLLQVRQMSLPDEIVGAVSSLDDTLGLLATELWDEETELGQLRALTQTSALINSSLDVDVVLAEAMDQIINLTGAERGYILLINDEGDLEFRIAREPGDQNEPADDVSFTILNLVVSSGEPMLTDNASNDPRMAGSDTVSRYTLRSIMCVPLAHKDAIRGAIYVDNRYRSAVFTERELNLLTAFSNQIAIAVENALLFAQVQATLAEITRMKELLENVFTSIESGVITTSATDQVMTFNRAASQILVTPPEKAISQPLHDLLPRITGFEDVIARAREAAEAVILEAQTQIPARGDVVLNLRVSPLRDVEQDIQGVALVMDDMTEQRARDEQVDLLRRYLPPGMVENIEQIAGLALGGERREVTCMFIWACPYTALPDETHALMEMLNLYLETTTRVVHSAQGIIDKYMGNEVMVLFNTQLNPQPDHARNAIDTALALREAYVNLYRQLGYAVDCDHIYRIGIHSGVATLGNVGSLNRRNFSAIGDTINLAKRLEENATPGQIIISEDTLMHIRQTSGLDDGIRFEEREALQVKGRRQSTRIYEVFRA